MRSRRGITEAGVIQRRSLLNRREIGVAGYRDRSRNPSMVGQGLRCFDGRRGGIDCDSSAGSILCRALGERVWLFFGTLVVGGPWLVLSCLFNSALIADEVASSTTSHHECGPGDLADKKLSEHADSLRRALPRGTWEVVVESPFLVIGNEPVEKVRQRATGTVRWAYGHLARDFFPRQPDRPIEVWLLRDAASYQRISQERFAIKPPSPFGYYSTSHTAILANVATGSGTVVHEMVHALIAVDFPKCPAWFNEGLASLFEECEERNGTIWGLPNWRLRGLQRAIRAQETMPIAAICELDDNEFYRRRESSAYSQSRYLCLYLQERGVLREFYQRLRDAGPKGSTCVDTLNDLLGHPNRLDFEREWADYVMGLSEVASPKKAETNKLKTD